MDIIKDYIYSEEDFEEIQKTSMVKQNLIMVQYF